MKITNSLGQEIFTEKLNGVSARGGSASGGKGIYEKQLDSNKYPVGIYNLQLVTDKGVITRQIIIE